MGLRRALDNLIGNVASPVARPRLANCDKTTATRQLRQSQAQERHKNRKGPRKQAPMRQPCGLRQTTNVTISSTGRALTRSKRNAASRSPLLKSPFVDTQIQWLTDNGVTRY